MSVLVTGGSGFLGRAVLARLPGALAPTSAELDLTDGSRVREAIADWKPDIVVHLAALVGGITANMSRQADFLIDNLRMDANVLAAVRAHPPTHLISVLSTCMYPDRLAEDRYPMHEGLVEEGPPPPTNAAYAAAKRALWHGTRGLGLQYGVGYSALVPSNLYGPGDHYGEGKSHFLAAAVHRIEEARLQGEMSVEFFGTGVALRQYLFVDDLAALVELLIERGPVNETLNVAPDEMYSIRELAAHVADAAQFQGDVVFSGEGSDGQIRKDVSSARLRHRVPEWADLETSLVDGLALTIDRYRADVATC